MKHILKYIFITFTIYFWGINTLFASINFSVDPIKYELQMNPGDSITLDASIRNNGNQTITMPTAVSDFQSSGSSGTPSFVRKSELVFPDQELSSWITLSSTGVTVAPGDKATISFTINAPSSAVPGGHYGAIFFKNPGSETSGDGKVGINVDYGILVLVTITGDVIIDGSVGDIGVGGATSSNTSETGTDTSSSEENTGVINSNEILGITTPDSTFDDCPLGDFTKSNFDKKCFDTPFVPETENETDSKFTGIIPLGEQEEFGIYFDVPFKNTGTTHVKPTGKIILEDSEGNQLKAIGREVVVSNLGVIIGENIVDYIPINDSQGNVLPNTNRIFEGEWKGFPYKTYDNEGNQVMDYWHPSEYYTNKNKQEAGFLMFWERVSEARRHEKITALIDVSYTNEKGEVVEFNSAKDFYIDYTEEYVSINPYIVIPFFIFGGLFLLYIVARFLLIFGKYKKRCKNCNIPIRKNWHVCPKCKKKIK